MLLVIFMLFIIIEIFVCFSVIPFCWSRKFHDYHIYFSLMSFPVVLLQTSVLVTSRYYGASKDWLLITALLISLLIDILLCMYTGVIRNLGAAGQKMQVGPLLSFSYPSPPILSKQLLPDLAFRGTIWGWGHLSCKKWTILHLEHWWGAHLPFCGCVSVGG